MINKLIKLHLLVLLTLSNYTFAADSYCQDIVYKFDLDTADTEIDISNMNPGDHIANIVISHVSGMCNNSLNPGLRNEWDLFVNGISSVTCSSSNLVGFTGGVSIYPCRSGATVFAAGVNNTSSSTWQSINPVHPLGISLLQKPIGESHFTIRKDLFNNFQRPRYNIKYGSGVVINGGDGPLNLTAIGDVDKQITLINRVSCNIITDDSIDFGNVLLSSINAGAGPSKIANVGINCDGVPLKYTMTLSSATNVATTNPIAGILGSTTNNNMGYQLTWGDSQIGGTDNHLSLNVDYPSKAAKQNQIVPIKLKPVSLRHEAVKPGRVDASLRITIRIY
ncbi:fimbrial protein [Photobacterium piscicola]|uniref:fimbrial protein n=1 Tax=Photobacterium piscicola TaxID=1378299 RepID=UPI0037358E76